MSTDRGSSGHPTQEDVLAAMTAARDERRAQEAAAAAAKAAEAERLAAEKHAIEKARHELDLERAKRKATRDSLEREAANLLAEKENLEASQRAAELERHKAAEEDQRLSDEVSAERKRLDEEVRERQAVRQRLLAEADRLSAEREALAEVVAREEERERALRHAEERMTAQREREAEAEAQRVAARRAALQRHDERIEERAQAARKQSEARPQTSPGGTRRKSRLQISASVVLDHEGVVLALPLINASLTGALIGADGKDLSALQKGVRMLVTLVSNVDAKQQVDLIARVVRQDGETLAIDWSEDEDAAHAVAQMIDELSGPPEAPELEAQRIEIEEIDLGLQVKEAEQRTGRGQPVLPPPPPQPSRPRKARVVLSASVLVDHDGTVVELPLLNVSVTGGLVRTHATVLAEKRVGSLLLMTLAASHGDHPRVDLLARVVRHEGDLTAVDWSQDEPAGLDVARLLQALAKDA